MYLVETAFTFEAAHRLYNVNTYSNECRLNVHGHSYQVRVIIGRMELNDAGMVVDFKKLKEILHDKIEKFYDHAWILQKDDPLVPYAMQNCAKVIISSENPTAENMAKEFTDIIKHELTMVDPELFVRRVSVRETENNIATYQED